MIDQVQTTRLPNGLTILTEHMPGLRSVSFGIWVRRGTRHESASLNGICHFIEHALFKGTHRRSAHEIASESDRLGGQLDAYTTHEMTGFAMKVVDTELEGAFDLLADLLLHPRFDEDDLASRAFVGPDVVGDVTKLATARAAGRADDRRYRDLLGIATDLGATFGERHPLAGDL